MIAVSSDQAAVDERVAQALLELDDPDIIMDLRRFNGKLRIVSLTHFGMNCRLFWMRWYWQWMRGGMGMCSTCFTQAFEGSSS